MNLNTTINKLTKRIDRIFLVYVKGVVLLPFVMKSHLAISKEFFNQLFTMGMTSSGNLRRAKKKKKKKKKQLNPFFFGKKRVKVGFMVLKN
jgi:uncharacterized membrane protein